MVIFEVFITDNTNGLLGLPRSEISLFKPRTTMVWIAFSQSTYNIKDGVVITPRT